MLLSLLVFLLLIGSLIFIHELGHFLMAKLVGMRVDEFAIGFPPKLLGKKRGDTLYALNLIPLGGYVKIHGDSPEDTEDPNAFYRKSVWARILVILAGVAMNLLVPFLLLTIAFSVGFTAGDPAVEQLPGATVVKSEVLVVQVLDNSPAASAGIVAGDGLVSLQMLPTGSEVKITSIQELQHYTQLQQSQHSLTQRVTFTHDGQTKQVEVKLNSAGPSLGVGIENINRVRLPIWRAPQAAGREISDIVQATLSAFGQFGRQLFVHGELSKEVSGPVGIYKASHVAVQQGFEAVFFLLIVLSLNLAILNSLPIPALDGGRLLFTIIEAIFSKRIISLKVEHAFHTIGMALLILLSAIIAFRDIHNLF